jgi:hypothetical protein
LTQQSLPVNRRVENERVLVPDVSKNRPATIIVGLKPSPSAPSAVMIPNEHRHTGGIWLAFIFRDMAAIINHFFATCNRKRQE